MSNQHYNLESVYPYHTFEFYRLIPPFLIQCLQLMGGTSRSMNRFTFPLNTDVNPIIQIIDTYFNKKIFYGQIITLSSCWVYDSESQALETFIIYPKEGNLLNEVMDNPEFVDLIPQSEIGLENPNRYLFPYEKLLACTGFF